MNRNGNAALQSYDNNAAEVTMLDDWSSPWANRMWDLHGYGLKALRKPRTPNGLHVAAASLRRDEWIFFEDAVVEEGVRRIGLVDDFIAAGLTFQVPNAMGKTEIVYATTPDLQPADVTIDALPRSRNDRLTFGEGKVPNPVIHKDWFLPRRYIEASRERGEPIPTLMVRTATRKVLEKGDDLAINGGGPTLHGGQAWGLLNAPNRVTIAFSAGPWDNPGITGDNIFKDIQNAIAAMHTMHKNGPWNLYYGSALEMALTGDYKPATDKSIRTRLLELDGLNQMRVLDQMPPHTAVLVDMNRDTVEVAMGEPPQPIQWEIEGGMGVNFKVMMIRTTIVKATYSGVTGIVQIGQGS